MNNATLATAVLLATLGLGGCFGEVAEDSYSSLACRSGPNVWYFTEEYQLSELLPGEGIVRPGGAGEAFAVAAPPEFLSPPLNAGIQWVSNLTLEIWAESDGAAFIPSFNPDDAGDGYHFFNLLGNQEAFMPDGAVTYEKIVTQPGEILHVTQHFTPPTGGWVIEAGDSIRAMLTSLVASADDQGHYIYVGGPMASQLRFDAKCYQTPSWQEIQTDQVDVAIAGNQGLLLGAIPDAENANHALVDFELLEETERLTIRLNQTGTNTVTKNDMDLVLLDETGQEIWSGGSPAPDESMRLWKQNLKLIAPPGDYTVKVNSYSGAAYTGTVTIIQEAGQ